MRAVSLLAVLPAILLANPDPARGYALAGSGEQSCSRWTAAHGVPGTPEALVQEQWVLGFLSGVGFMMLGELDPLHGLAMADVSRWVGSWCDGHPSATIEAAARSFIQEHPR
jgi:hypothetical protein